MTWMKPDETGSFYHPDGSKIDAVALSARALAARKAAWTPYSAFAVGAALQTFDGEIYCGCNVETASYGLTCCAERTAVFAAVAAGRRRFSAIAIAGGPAKAPIAPFTTPCGACRQVLREFDTGDMLVILQDATGQLRATTLAQLLPESFGPEDLEG